MRSIPTIFCKDKDTRLATDRKLQMVKWVFEGKGIATRKFDGLAILVRHGKPFYRWEWRNGTNAGLMPKGFERLENPDPKRPHAPIPGWVPVPSTFLSQPKGTIEKAIKQAWDAFIQPMKDAEKAKAVSSLAHNPYGPDYIAKDCVVPDGTYELCGPSIRGNHEKYDSHMLILHGSIVVKSVPRTFAGLSKFFETFTGEGIVWHYKVDGGTLMAKIKKTDFPLVLTAPVVEPPIVTPEVTNGIPS